MSEWPFRHIIEQDSAKEITKTCIMESRTETSPTIEKKLQLFVIVIHGALCIYIKCKLRRREYVMTMTKEEILEVHRFRHATKEFDPSKTISDDDFEFILETARLSPSSFSTEPWRFVVVQNEQLRNKIKNSSYGAASKLPEASHFVIILARTPLDTRYDSAYLKEHLTRRLELLEEFQRHDFKLLDHERFLTDWAIKQTYIPLANMMTAAA
jgi:hypothetical protein